MLNVAMRLLGRIILSLKIFKGGPNAQLIFNIFDFCVPSDRVGSDEFGHTGKSVKFGPVWQTEALQSRKIRFS